MASIWLAHLTVYDPALPGPRTLYFSSQGYTSGATYPPGGAAHTAYDPRISQPAVLRRDCFDAGTTGGASRVGYGALELVNVDGGLDYLADLGIDGQPFSLIFGSTKRNGAPVWQTVLTGTVEQPSIGWSSVTLRLRDRQAELAKPLSPTTYLGTNALPNGLEGVDDLKGKNKPKLFGRVFNISPPMVNTSRLIYQVSDGQIFSIEAVYDRGLALTKGADYVSQADMETTAPAASTFRVWPAGGLFRLGSSPTGIITADAAQGGNQNQLTYSQDTTNPAWGKSQWTVTQNATLAPDGTLTGERIDTIAPYGYAYRQVQQVQGRFTASAYVKAGTDCRCALDITNAGWTSYVAAEYSPVTKQFSVSSSGAVTDAVGHVEDVGGGWYRIVVTATFPNETFYLYHVVSANSETIYLWGTQLEAGAIATPYVKTTDVPDPVSAAKSRTAGQLIQNIASTLIAPADVSSADVTALDAANSSEVGYWVADAANANVALDEISNSVGAWWGFDRLGKFRLAQFAAPSGTPAAYLTAADIIKIDRVASNDAGRGIPAWKVSLNYKKFYTVQPNDLAGAVDVVRRADLAKEYRTVEASDATIQTRHKLATPLEFSTLLIDAAAAQAEATRRLAMYKSERATYTARLGLDPDILTTLDLGNVVRLTLPRFGMSAGRDFRVIGLQPDYRLGVIDITLWG